MPGMGPAPGGSMVMKDVRDLQPRAAHGRARLRAGSRSPVDQWCQPIEGAGYGPDRGVGDAGVKPRGVEFGMAQKCLNHANIDILLEEMGGEAMPQRVWRHALLDPRGLGSGTDGAAELAGREQVDPAHARGNTRPP